MFTFQEVTDSVSSATPATPSAPTLREPLPSAAPQLAPTDHGAQGTPASPMASPSKRAALQQAAKQPTKADIAAAVEAAAGIKKIQALQLPGAIAYSPKPSRLICRIIGVVCTNSIIVGKLCFFSLSSTTTILPFMMMTEFNINNCFNVLLYLFFYFFLFFISFLFSFLFSFFYFFFLFFYFFLILFSFFFYPLSCLLQPPMIQFGVGRHVQNFELADATGTTTI